MLIRGFYSDPHFGHAAVVNYCKRPFVDVEEMDTQLIDNYNDLIGKGDTVLWLGDCFFGSSEYAKDVMDELNGTKILVWGGHDGSISRMLKVGFSMVMYFAYVSIADQTCLARHYPYPGSKHRDGRIVNDYVEQHLMPLKNQVLIHGHTHTDKRLINNQIHVGVDAWDFKPVMFEQVEELVKTIKNIRDSVEGY